jgi:transposase-like protein
MKCPHCKSKKTTERSDRTELGYRRYRCRNCKRQFNERTGTLFNRLQLPTDVVFLIVLWRLRYKLSLRDLAEMFLERGFVFTHEAVREWERLIAPLITQQLRKRRRGKVGNSWYVDETYVKINGEWHYLYRAIDRDGNLVDVRLSAKRDKAAAKAFFHKAKESTGVCPDRVTTDGHKPYPAAIKAELGESVKHRTNQYLNNRLEQDHRDIKQRYYPMRGFKSFDSASRFCCAFDEVRHHFKARSCRRKLLSSHAKRRMHKERFAQLAAMIGIV